MESLPPIVTHILEDDQHDAVLMKLRSVGLFNRPEDPVKVVYHPEFITPVSPLWGIEYEQFVRGCHLGLFPSAYEPWGYTPLECMALGTPALSSDLAGFGRYVMENLPDHENWGLSVLGRRGRSFSEAASDLAGRLFQFCTLSRRDRIELRNSVERRSWEFDWAKVGGAYQVAHERALEHCG
jgi:glycogen(starch) synthase